MGMRWGATELGLTVLDLAAFAWNAYSFSPEDYKNLTDQSFRGAKGLPAPVHEGNWFTSYHSFPRWLITRFPASLSRGSADPRQDTVVVTVKGTSTNLDVLTDASLFSTIKILQWLNVVSLLPERLVKFLVKFRFEPTVLLEEDIWKKMEQGINDSMNLYPNARFVLTGHSLGGGVAQTLAARLELPAVVFSAPGILYSSWRFGASEQALKRNVVVVMPDFDPVPLVDEHVGMVQRISCREKDGDPPLGPECHSMARTACELWRSCGDPRGRDFTATCAHFLDGSSMESYDSG